MIKITLWVINWRIKKRT